MAGTKSTDLDKLLKDRDFLCGMLLDPVRTAKENGLDLNKTQYRIIDEHGKKILALWSAILELILMR